MVTEPGLPAPLIRRKKLTCVWHMRCELQPAIFFVELLIALWNFWYLWLRILVINRKKWSELKPDVRWDKFPKGENFVCLICLSKCYIWQHSQHHRQGSPRKQPEWRLRDSIVSLCCWKSQLLVLGVSRKLWSRDCRLIGKIVEMIPAHEFTPTSCNLSDRITKEKIKISIDLSITQITPRGKARQLLLQLDHNNETLPYC